MSMPSPRSSRHSAISGNPMSAGGIAAIYFLEQRDAQPFRLDGTGAVEGRLAVEVSADFLRIQRPECAGDIDQRGVAAAACGIDQRDARMKDHGFAGKGAQLCKCGIPRPGLADRYAGTVGDLVGTDHQGVRILDRNRARLGFGQAKGGLRRGLSRERGFVHARRRDQERQPQALEQRAAVP
jgi:hypothetical protein